MRPVLFAILIFAAASASAEEVKPSDAVKKFCAEISYRMNLCQLAGETALLTLSRDGMDHVSACVIEAKQSSRPRFQSARDATETNKTAQSSIKDVYADFLAAIDGALPRPGDHVALYEHRMEQSKAALKRACIRIDLDL